MTDVLPVTVDRGQGPPVVLLHGLGTDHRSWTYVLQKLDLTRNRVIALDLLGFGEAPKPSDVRYAADDHADAVIRTLDGLGISDATLAGHSMGYLIAARVALERSDLAARLVLPGSPVFRRISVQRNPFRFWERESTYLALFRLVAHRPDLTLAAAEEIDTFAPMVKGMEITEETWPALQEEPREHRDADHRLHGSAAAHPSHRARLRQARRLRHQPEPAGSRPAQSVDHLQQPPRAPRDLPAAGP